jgi:hypothetical protein
MPAFIAQDRFELGLRLAGGGGGGAIQSNWSLVSINESFHM